MKIVSIEVGAITVQLTPEQCKLLAQSAKAHAPDASHEAENLLRILGPALHLASLITYTLGTIIPYTDAKALLANINP